MSLPRLTTPAHEQSETIHLVIAYPEHLPRKTDPHYKAFTAFERRAKKQGLMKCAVCGATQDVQTHHSKVEFSLINAIDLTKFDELYGLHLDDAGFKDFVEGPGNAEFLCRLHHVGHEGIHLLPEPLWLALRVQVDGPPIVRTA